MHILKGPQRQTVHQTNQPDFIHPAHKPQHYHPDTVKHFENLTSTSYYWEDIIIIGSFVVLGHISIKSYDLIVALTQGGPGISTTMPALFMTQTAFHKSQVGLSAASAMMMFMAVAAVIIPYLYSELRRENVS